MSVAVRVFPIKYDLGGISLTASSGEHQHRQLKGWRQNKLIIHLTEINKVI